MSCEANYGLTLGVNSSDLPGPAIADRGVRAGYAPLGRILLGSILSVAVAARAYEFFWRIPGRAPHVSLVILAFLVLEGLWALWLFIGVCTRQLWFTSFAFLGGMLSVSLRHVLWKSNTCGCFGRVEITPWLTLIFDLCVLSAIILFGHSRRRELGYACAIFLVGAATGWMIAAPLARSGTNPAASGTDARMELTRAWASKPFPLLQGLSRRAQLERGSWLVLIHRRDCPICAEVVPRFEYLARDLLADANASLQIAFLELGLREAAPLLKDSSRSGVWAHTHDDPLEPLPTPIVVALQDGIVLQLWFDPVPTDIDRLLTAWEPLH